MISTRPPTQSRIREPQSMPVNNTYFEYASPGPGYASHGHVGIMHREVSSVHYALAPLPCSHGMPPMGRHGVAMAHAG